MSLDKRKKNMKLVLKPVSVCRYTPFFCISSSFVLIWMSYAIKDVYIAKIYLEKASTNVRLPKKLKYILLWSDNSYTPLSYLEEGQTTFLKNNCSVVNCYVTADKDFFNGDHTTFDAIVFNERTMRKEIKPKLRLPHQKYIFIALESSDNYPVCDAKFDGFFNMTATYRLNSDIILPYLLIKDKQGQIVGPKRKMSWVKDMAEVGNEYDSVIRNRTKAAAWFVSNCQTRSNRSELVAHLNARLKLKYQLSIDVYGECGALNCPRRKKSQCEGILNRDYFFYMALENSFADDYVTEKVLTALNQNVVPIVYGGADYSRFLPPGSYIDAKKNNIEELADIMYTLIHSPKEYKQFFKWKSYYTYHNSLERENMCNICEALNDETVVRNTTIYEEFRAWWNPNYTKRCNKT